MQALPGRRLLSVWQFWRLPKLPRYGQVQELSREEKRMSTSKDKGENTFYRRNSYTCPSCNGKKTLRQVCPTCNGRKVARGLSVMYACPTCGGAGRVEVPCDRCKGTGRISTSL